MAVPENRLKFILNERSQSWLGSELGISRSTVSRVSRGLATLPKHTYTKVRNLYQNEAYKRLRTAGAPSGGARRFSAYSIDKVQDTIDALDMAKTHMTSNVMTKYLHDRNIEVNPKNINKYWDAVEKIVTKSLQQSPKALERILDYSVFKIKV